MFRRNRIAWAVSLALALSSWNAHAVLERTGPTSTAPSIGGYPAWYQDTTGLTLEFCDTRNQAELDGWCLLMPGDVSAVPENFPANFFDEHFWFAADAGMTTASGGKARLVLAVEAAFVADVTPGGQIAFSRIRLVLNPVPVTGDYRIIHPYGEKTLHAEAGERIFFTDDVGINCAAGQFDCATQSELGPFLLPAEVPGGAELPAVPGPVPGKLYIADPSRSGPVTGSTLPDFIDSSGASRNHNIFRIEGPAGSALGGPGIDAIETTDFSLMGRVFTGPIPSKIDVARASYVRNADGRKVDVFASAFETTQGRLPTQPRPTPIAPQLAFFDAPCAGVVDETGVVRPPYSAPRGATETQMFAIEPGLHWGQTQPAAIPGEVCVKDGAARDAAGNIVPAYVPKRVTDEVTIAEASFDRPSGTLTVSAASSDEIAPPTLTLAFGTFRGEMAGGEIVVPDLVAAPASVRVLSTAFGADQRPVRATFAAAAPPRLLVAANDTFSLAEDSPAQVLDVLTNDGNVAGGTVDLTSLPRLGSAVLNPDGTLSYTPALNAYGTDQLSYTVTVGTEVSNTATVTIDITPVNDAPVAVNDSVAAIANMPVTLNVLGNDSDPDGASDLVAATNVTGSVPAGASVSLAGPQVTFLATAPGTYVFTYQAQDAAAEISANAATVTVQVSGAESLSIKRAEYVRSKSCLRAEGTIGPAANQTVALEFVNSGGTVLGSAGSAVTDAAGNWDIDATVPLPTGATALKATSSNGTVRAANLSLK